MTGTISTVSRRFGRQGLGLVTSRRMWRALGLILGIAVLAAPAAVHAQSTTLYWDSDASNTADNANTGVGLGGAGTWATADLKWWNGSSLQAYPTNVSVPDWTDVLAVFGGGFTDPSGTPAANAPGTVTLNSSINFGGLKFTTSGYTLATSGANTITLDAPGSASPVIDVAAGTATISGNFAAGGVNNSGFTKAGGGTLVLSSTTLNNLTGDIILKAGTLTIQGQLVAQMTSSAYRLRFGTLNLLNNGTASNTTINFGNTVNLESSAIINVNNGGANSSNVIQLGALNMGNNVLTVTNGNTYGLDFTGTTTLNGDITAFNVGINPSASNAIGVVGTTPIPGALNLTGQVTNGVINAITQASVLTKQGAGTMVLANIANDYSGGTVIQGGMLILKQVSTTAGSETYANAGANVSGNNIYALPGGVVTLSSLSSIGSNQTLYVQSTPGALAGVAAGQINSGGTISDLVVQGSANKVTTAQVGAYGGVYMLYSNGSVFGAATGIDLTQNLIGANAAGSGAIWIGAAKNVTFQGPITVGADNIYRIGTNYTGATLTLDAVTGSLASGNLFDNGPSASVLIGSQFANVLGTGTNNTGTTVMLGNQGYSGTTTINKGSTASIGGTTTSGYTTPFGSNTTLNLFGNLNLSGNNNTTLAQSVFNVMGGGNLFYDYSSFVAAGTNTNIHGNPGTVNLSTGTLRLTGATTTAAALSVQNVTTVNFQGGDFITLSRGSATTQTATMNITNLNRIANTNGTIVVNRSTTAATWGTDVKLAITNLNGSAIGTPAVIPWMVDATTTPTFVGYNGTSVINPTLFVAASDVATQLQASNASSLTDITGTITLAGTRTAQAARVGSGVLSGNGPLNIVGDATSGAAGLILTGSATHTVPFVFGSNATTADREAVIYNSADVTLSGAVSATGLTKFGGNLLNLTGSNIGLQGTITVNQGSLAGTVAGYNYRPVRMAGGVWAPNGTANGNYRTELSVIEDAAIDANTNNIAGLQTLTIGPRVNAGATDPIVMTTNNGGFSIQGMTTLNGGGLALRTNGNRDVYFNGGLTGGASAGLYRWGNTNTTLHINRDNAATFSGPITINQWTVATDWAGSGQPFGTGAITVNPGGNLRIAATSNIAANVVTLNSDMGGIPGLSLGYNSPSTAINSSSFSGVTVNNLGSPFDMVLGISAVGFSGSIDQSATGFRAGKFFIGSDSAGWLTGSLNVGAGDYKLGGLNGTINIAKQGYLTGNNNVQIGALNNSVSAKSTGMLGAGGTVAIYSPQTLTSSSSVYLNGANGFSNSTGLTVGTPDAIGAATLVFNGGFLQPDGNTGINTSTPERVFSNPIRVIGDIGLGFSNAAANFHITSAFALADQGQSGVTRTINVGSAIGRTYLEGVISDGTGNTLNSISKTGTGVLIFGTTGNTYSGYTNINAGYIALQNSENEISPNSTVTFGGGQIGVWDKNITLTRTYISGTVGAAATSSVFQFDVGPGLTLTDNGADFSGTGRVRKFGQGLMILSGVNSYSGETLATNGILQVSADANMGSPLNTNQIYLNGGTFRFADSFITARNVFVDGTSALDVVAGKTVKDTGTVSGTVQINKTGAGTFWTTGTNTNTILTVANGDYMSDSNQPFAVNTNLTIGGGSVYLNKAGAQTFAGTGTLTFNAGGHLKLNQQTSGQTTSFTETNFVRNFGGTLVIDAIGGTLGAPSGTSVKVKTTNIFGGAAASAIVNGIINPSILATDSNGIGNFVTYDATNGFTPISSYTTTDLNLGTATATANVSANQTLTGTRSIYAFRTDGAGTVSTINGGILKVTASNTSATSGVLTEGGIVVNDNVSFGTKILFDPTAAAGTPNASAGEGLIFVREGKAATFNGVFANSIVKYGKGDITFDGDNAIMGQLVINEGVYRRTSGANFSRLLTDLVLNYNGTFDVDGRYGRASSLGNSSTTMGGGIVTNLNTTANGSFSTFSTSATTFAGQITDIRGNSGLANTGTQLTFIKNGTQTLTLAGYTSLFPDAGNNTYTGGTVLNLGTLLVNNPQALGGAYGSTPGDVSLFGGTLDLRNNGGLNNGTIVLGSNESTINGGRGLNMNLYGPTTVNVQNNGANQGNAWQINNLNLGENTLTITGNNSYRLRVAGTTSILGGFGTINSGVDSFSNTTGAGIELAGQIVDGGTAAGALNKLTGTNRNLIISGTNNTYSGGTNIQGGYVQATGRASSLNDTAYKPLGTGAVTIYGGTGLRVVDKNSLSSLFNNNSIRLLSRYNAYAAVGLDSDFDPSTIASFNSAFRSAYGTTLLITQPYFAAALDMSTIGDGNAFLGAGTSNVENVYIASTLGAGNGGVYRLTGAGGTLVFQGPDNVLTGSNFVQVGSPANNAIWGAVGFAGGTVTLRNSNDYNGGTMVAKSTTLQFETGGAVGSHPLGTGDVEVFGTLQTAVPGFTQNTAASTASFVNPATGLNWNNIVLRPGGTITINDYAGTVAGNNGRWSDSVGINLNGGTFRLIGAQGYDSAETIGAVTVAKGGALTVSRNTVQGGTATLTLGTDTGSGQSGIVRSAGGSLVINTSAVASINAPNGGNALSVLGIASYFTGTTNAYNASAVLGNLTTTAGGTNYNNYDRLVVTGGTANINGGAGFGGVLTTNAGPSTMAPVWIVDATTNNYVAYGSNGFQDVLATAGTLSTGQSKYNTMITAAGALPTGGAGTETVDLSGGAGTLNNDTSYWSLRTNQQITQSVAAKTLNLNSGGLLAYGNNLLIGGITNATTGTSIPLQFTVSANGGAGEAVVYNTTTVTMNAAVASANLTKFGGGNLFLTASNNITGNVYINAGTIQAQTAVTGPTGGNSMVGSALNGRDVILNGNNALNGTLLRIDGMVGGVVGGFGSTQLPGASRATANLNSNVIVEGDAAIDNNGQAVLQQIPTLTVRALSNTTNGGIMTVGLNGIQVNGATTLQSTTNTNIYTQANGITQSILMGPVTSTGGLSKWGTGQLMLGATNNSLGFLTINGTDPGTNVSVVGSLVRTGNPFGTGAITVNPGGVIRILDNSNIASNTVTFKSDYQGLAGLAIGYNAPVSSSLFGTGAGKINVTTTGEYAGTLNLDVPFYTQSLNLATLEGASYFNGKIWLGTSTTTNYLAPTLGVGTGSTYRLGGGGSGFTMTMGVNAFENVLTGNNTVQIGATPTNGSNANGLSYANGQSVIVLSNRNNFTGNISVNRDARLVLNSSFAAGTGKILFNGGGMRFDANIGIVNDIDFTGDQMDTQDSSGTDFAFLGNVNLAANGPGTRTLAFRSLGVAGFQGVISGANSNIIKAGSSTTNLVTNQVVVFNNNNTYTGTTTINNGFLGAGTDVLRNTDGAFGNSESPIILGNVGGESGGKVMLNGQILFARDIIALGASGAGGGSNEVRAQTLNTAVITGGLITPSTATPLAINSLQATAAGTTNAWRGGVLDLQGPISGAGAVTFGANNVQGVIRLSSGALGIGDSTFVGGSTLQAARLQIAADTYYAGTAAAPTIISGPLGTGTFTFGAGNTNGGGAIEAYGADRTIVNALGALNTAGTTINSFTGHYGLTFTRNLDLNSDGSVRSRTWTVNQTQGTTNFSGVLSASGGTGAGMGVFTKNGAGTLLLSNVANTFATTTGISVSAGVLNIAADLSLGAAANNVTMAGGTLQLANTAGSVSSARIYTLTAGSGIDTPSGTTLTLTNATAYLGAQALTKTGAGTLAVNGNTTQTTTTTLNIGGAPLGGANGAANLFSGQGGGTVSTSSTSTTVNPFTTTTGTINLGGGTLALNGAGAAIPVGTLTYGAGSYFQTNSGGASMTASGSVSRTAGSFGVLTILPSAISNLGGAGTEKLISTTAPGATSGILNTPSVFVRAISGGDANFTTYVAGTGFQLHAATTAGTLGTSTTTTLADLAAPDSVAASTTTDALAVRTANDITAGDANSLLRINNGGLLLNYNGSAGANISTNVRFGTAAALTEGIVYVNNASNTATLSGNFSSTNFTKAGPGNLVISGTANSMPLIVASTTSVALPTMMVNEGTLSFAGNSSLPSGGSFVVATADNGILDLNNLTSGASFAGLSGTGNVTASGVTGRTLTLNGEGYIGNGNPLTVGTYNGLIKDGTAAVSLVKSGSGIQVLGYNNTYSGGTTINAGAIYNTAANVTVSQATYGPMSTGVLSVSSYQGLGTGDITLAGGVLDIRNPVAANEVRSALDVVQFGPGANGYNIIVAANNNFGQSNTTSALTFFGPGAIQAINNLTINAPMLTVAGTTDNTLYVSGNTTLANDTTLYLNRNLYLGGQIVGTGGSKAITKIGSNTLYVLNTDRVNTNQVSQWNILQGSVEARMSQGSGNPLGTGLIVLNNGTLNIRHDGDGTTDPQVIDTFKNNNIQIGSMNAANSATLETNINAVSTIGNNLGTTNTGNANSATNYFKTLQFGQLRFGGALASAFYSPNVANGYAYEFTGGMTMLNDAYFNPGGNVTFDGAITGSGTLFKQGGGNLYVNTTSNTTGGTVLAGASTFFARFAAQTTYLNTTATLGGNVTVQPGAALRFTGAGNVASGQRIDVRSNLATFGLVGIGDNSALSAYNLRVPTAYGPFDPSLLTSLNSGGGVLAINSTYDQTLDMGTIGDGTFYMGGTGNLIGLNGSYNAATMGVGAKDFSGTYAYRLSGGGGTLYVGLPTATAAANSNQLTGATNVIIGSPLNVNGANTGNLTGTVIVASNQNYTGSTLINRGSNFEYRGTMATSGIDLWGQLTVGGSGTLNIGTTNLRPGSTLILDNQIAPAAGPVTDRIADASAVTLNSTLFRLIGNSTTLVTEKLGDVTANGGSFLFSQRSLTGRWVELNLNSLSLGTGATLAISQQNSGALGSDERVTVTTPGAYTTVTNGMVPAAIYNNTDYQFLNYGPNGYVNAGWDKLFNATTTLAATTDLSTNRLLVNTATQTIPDAGLLDVYALRADSAISAATTTAGTATLQIRSGGLLNAVSATLNPKIVFGTAATGGSAAPGYINVVSGQTLTIGTTTAVTTTGQITATALSKGGDGTLQIDAEQSYLTTNNVPIYLNRGALTIRTPDASTTTTKSVNSGGTIYFTGNALTLNYRSDNAFTPTAPALPGSTIFSNSIDLPTDVSLATINVATFAAATSRTMAIAGGLTFHGVTGALANEQGQILNITGANTMNFQVNGTTTLPSSGTAQFVTNTTGTSLYLAGLVTDGVGGTAKLVKTGSQTLFLTNTTAGLNRIGGGVLLSGGTLEVRGVAVTTASTTAGTAVALAQGGLGSGPVDLYTGTLNLRIDGNADATRQRISLTGTSGGANSIDLNVKGNATISADRTGFLTTTSAKNIQFRNMSIGAATLTTTTGNSYGWEIAGTTTLLGNPTFNTSTQFQLEGPVTEATGAGLYIVKNGGSTLYFASSTANTFSGGVYVNQGTLAFGDLVASNQTAKAGTGTIQVNPGATVQFRSTTNLNSGQQVRLLGIDPSLAVLRLATTTAPWTQTALTNAITSDSTNSALVIESVAMANQLNMATIGDGTFFLGGNTQNYTNNLLGVGAGNIYRLGGGGGALSLVPTTSTSPVLANTVATNAFGGSDTAVLVGALGGNGTATVVMNATNTYNGGTVVNRGTTLTFASGGSNLALGTSTSVDVFGTLNAENTSGSFRNAGGTANNYAPVLHPGSQLRFNSGLGTINNDRWLDSQSLTLNGALLTLTGTTAGTVTEKIGDLTFALGSRIGVARGATTTTGSELQIQSLNRSGNGTLVFTSTQLGNGLITAGGERVTVYGTTPSNVTGTNMLPGWIVDGGSGNFVTYGSNGFVGATANQTVASNTTFTTGLTSGNDLVWMRAGTTQVVDNPVIYALRLEGTSTLNNAPGKINTITLGGNNLDGGALLNYSNSATINTNLKWGTAGDKEGLLYNSNTVTFNGDLFAGSVTKFGLGTLTIQKDQTTTARGSAVGGYTGGWRVNEGALQANTFGALGDTHANNTVYLNGNQASTATLNLRANQGTGAFQAYTLGRVYATDNALISYDPQADDRNQGINDVTIISTGKTMVEAQLQVSNNRNRSILFANELEIAPAVALDPAKAILNVNATAQVGGLGSGFSVDHLKGAANTTLTKWGTGVLYVRGDSSSQFSGPINIEQGAIQVQNLNALGDNSGTNTVTVSRWGILDINVANFARVPTYNAGSIERWSIDSARSGSVNLAGATLQIAEDQTGTAAVTLNGGSIEGFLRTDNLATASNTNQSAVYRTVGSNVSFSLAGDSFLGQNITQGANGLDNGIQPNVTSPYANAAKGVILEVKGNIGESVAGKSLTKNGYDTVVLSGSNSYTGGTNVNQGQLRLGAANTLATTGDLRTGANGVIDLNGYDQMVGKLTHSVLTGGMGQATTANTGAVYGFVTNTSTQTNTLTVGNGIGVGTSFTYPGVIQYNVALTKVGGGTMRLTNTNTYNGQTTVSAGELLVNGVHAPSAASAAGFLVNGTGILGGKGTINSMVTVATGGEISAGDDGLLNGSYSQVLYVGHSFAPGKLTVAGLAMTGGQLRVDIQGAGPYTPASAGTNYDQVAVTTTTPTFAGNLRVETYNGFTPIGDGSETFVIVDNGTNAAFSDGVNGHFATVNGVTLVNTGGNTWESNPGLVNLGWNYKLTYDFGSNSNDLVMTIVPEPSTIGLLALGAVGLLSRRRRR